MPWLVQLQFLQPDLYAQINAIGNITVLGKQGHLAVTTLITSSNRCWQEPYNDGALPGSFLNSHNKEFLGPQPLAVILEGEFPDSFQGRALPAWPEVQTASTEEAEAADEELDTAPPLAPAATQLVLYGCAKMFDDVVIGGGQNALLLLNSVDALAHGEDLISIRAKMLTQRVIKPVGDGEKFIHRLSGVFLVPVILTIFGIARAAMRRKEATLYRQQLAHSSRSRA